MVLKLEGRLADQWVDELSRATNVLSHGAAGVTFDLDGISYIDARGVAWLRAARDRGARLTGGSGFINALVQDGTP